MYPLNSYCPYFLRANVSITKNESIPLTSPLSGTVVFLGDFCIRVTVRETCKKMFIVSGPKWFLVSVSTLLIIGSIMSPVLISSDLRENFQS